MADELLYEKWFYAYGGRAAGDSSEATKARVPLRGDRGGGGAVNWGDPRQAPRQEGLPPRLPMAKDTACGDAAAASESSHYPSFWDQDGTSSYLSERAPPKPYFEVDDDTLSMMREGIKGYQEHIEAAIDDLEGVEGEASTQVHLRWEYVNQAETAEKSLGELKRQSLNYQRDWSAVRSTYFNTETALQQLSNDNSVVEAANREEGKTLAQALATVSMAKAEKETLLRKIQIESEQEIGVTRDLQLNGEREREREVNLCIDNVDDMKRNVSAAQAKLARSREATSVLSEECDKIESSLVSANKDLKMLRNAERVEDSVLQTELAVSNMDDAQITNGTGNIIKKVNEEIDKKKRLRMQMKEMQSKSPLGEVDVAALFKREEAGWKRLHAKLRAKLKSLQKKQKSQDDSCSDHSERERGKDDTTQISEQEAPELSPTPAHQPSVGLALIPELAKASESGGNHQARKKSSKKKARVAKIN